MIAQLSDRERCRRTRQKRRGATPAPKPTPASAIRSWPAKFPAGFRPASSQYQISRLSVELHGASVLIQISIHILFLDRAGEIKVFSRSLSINDAGRRRAMPAKMDDLLAKPTLHTLTNTAAIQ
jgi:hypothetical protein